MSTLGELQSLRFLFRDRELDDEVQEELELERGEHDQEIQNDDKAGEIRE